MLKSTIIRVLAFAALFAYVLPAFFKFASFGSHFVFAGGILAALGIGVAYMALMFVLLAAWGIGMAPMKLSPAERLKMWPWTCSSVVIATVFALLGAHNLAFLGLSVTGWLPALIAGVLAVGVLHITMPAGSPKPGSLKSGSSSSAS